MKRFIIIESFIIFIIPLQKSMLWKWFSDDVRWKCHSTLKCKQPVLRKEHSTMVVQCPKTWYRWKKTWYYHGTCPKKKKTHQKYHGTFATFCRCIYCPELLICVSTVLLGSGKCQGALQQQAAIWQPSELTATPPAAVAKRPYKAGHASSFWRLRPHCATKRTKARAETMRNYPSKQPDLDTHGLPGRTRETVLAAFEFASGFDEYLPR